MKGNNKQFWNVYSGARVYSILMPHIAHYIDLQDKVLDLTQRDKIIGDFACGPGLFSMRCAQEGKEVYALDNSPAMVEYFKDSLVSDKSLLERITIELAPLDNIPLPNNSIDTAVCMNAIYTNKNPQKIAQELIRVAKNKVVITGPKPNYDHELLVQKADEDFHNHQLYRFFGREIFTFFTGNDELREQHMPSPLHREEAEQLLLNQGCTKILASKDVYHNQGFLVAAQK